MSTTATYLFIWNPHIYPELFDDHRNWLSGRLLKDSWSSGNNRSIRAGARVFLMRAVVEPKGLIASGAVNSDWYSRRHWRERGRTENANDIKWDTFAPPDKPLIGLAQLLRIRNQKAGLWLSAASGVRIPDAVARKLEDVWASAVARTGVPQRLEVLDPNEVPGAQYPEGGVRRVYVNAYERSELARQACIDHYGPACHVCGMHFGKRYGEIGRDSFTFIT